MPDVKTETKFYEVFNISDLKTADPMERAALISSAKNSSAALERIYGDHYDSRTLRDPASIFTSEQYPPSYAFAWLPDGPAQTAQDHVQQLHNRYMYMGWTAANLREIEEHIVIGEDAVKLGLPRSSEYRRIRESYNKQRAKEGKQPIDIPGALPERLKAKIGFIAKPTIDEKGHCWNGANQRLWWIARDTRDEQLLIESVRTNQLMLPSNARIENANQIGDFIEAGSDSMKDFINSPAR